MRLNLIDGGVLIYAYTRAQALDEGHSSMSRIWLVMPDSKSRSP
jgi:hypothetical protein